MKPTLDRDPNEHFDETMQIEEYNAKPLVVEFVGNRDQKRCLKRRADATRQETHIQLLNKSVKSNEEKEEEASRNKLKKGDFFSQENTGQRGLVTRG
jgi:hypothetical protein